MDRDLHPRVPDPVVAEAEAHSGGHAGVAIYVKVAVILTVITALEFAVLYIRALTPIVVPLLLVMSAGKFALVVLFFMHLRYDSRVLSLVFVGPLLIAIGIVVALTTLTGAFLVYGR
ncbi:MAG: cytochrome C oxidase subunit IV [Candidatus Rokubacteria bacterium]|nr:cytochrome C oxidase subunit IV [Candidatus Rokubacteria bacterium]